MVDTLRHPCDVYFFTSARKSRGLLFAYLVIILFRSVRPRTYNLLNETISLSLIWDEYKLIFFK